MPERNLDEDDPMWKLANARNFSLGSNRESLSDPLLNLIRAIRKSRSRKQQVKPSVVLASDETLQEHYESLVALYAKWDVRPPLSLVPQEVLQPLLDKYPIKNPYLPDDWEW